MYMKGSENMTELKEIIAKNLKKYRRLAKLSQVELAYKLHIRSSSISNWENGHNSIDIDTLFKVCKILGVSIDKMIEDDQSTDYVLQLDDETELFIEKFKVMPIEERQHLIRYAEWLTSQKNPSD